MEIHLHRISKLKLEGNFLVPAKEKKLSLGFFCFCYWFVFCFLLFFFSCMHYGEEYSLQVVKSTRQGMKRNRYFRDIAA